MVDGDQDGGDHRETFFAGADQLVDAVERAVHLLTVTNDPPVLFRRGVDLVRVRDTDVGPVIATHNRASLRLRLSEIADFIRHNSTKADAKVSPFTDLVDSLLTVDADLPSLVGLIRAPTLRPDGSTVDQPGYDPATRLLYLPTDELAGVTVPEQPSREQLDAATQLLTDLVADFPFVSPADRANALALLLTPVIRAAIGGQVPLGVIDAPQHGSGKGLLANVIGLVATGFPPMLMTAPDRGEGDAEWRKRITSTLDQAPVVALLDNLEGPLSSPSLAAMLTAERWTDRVLGQSRTTTLPVRTCWLATGNNVQIGGDLARRCVSVRMDPETSRPWHRTGFRHPDLAAYVHQRRPALIGSLLTLARAWWAAGRPPAAVPALGGFSPWARIVGGILAHAGVIGFLDNLGQLYDQVDDEARQWEDFLAVWHEQLGSRYVSLADLEVAVDTRSELKAVLPDELGRALDARGNSARIRAGKALKARIGRRYGADELHVTEGPQDRNKVRTYCVRSVQR